MKELINKITKWVGTDGLLHFLVCYALMLTLSPILGMAWAVLTTTNIAILKEVIDFCIQKDNDISQVMHDLLCDVVGIVVAIVALAFI
jgi:hypothetical protein